MMKSGIAMRANQNTRIVSVLKYKCALRKLLNQATHFVYVLVPGVLRAFTALVIPFPWDVPAD